MTTAAAPKVESGASQLRLIPRPEGVAWVGIAIIVVALLLALIGPYLAPFRAGQLVGDAYQHPGIYWLGTDVLGRDLLSRLLHGARLTVLVAAAATIVGFILGTTIGFLAAELRGWVDAVVVWLVDVFLSFPPLILGLLVIAALSPSVWVLIATIGLIHTPRVARVSRSVALGVAAMQFVDVARARGEPIYSILLREILPSSTRPLAVEFSLRFTYSVLYASGLGFLGLGIQPPETDWGSMLRENLDALHVGTYLPVLAPALAIGALAVGMNLIADWLGSRTERLISTELK